MTIPPSLQQRLVEQKFFWTCLITFLGFLLYLFSIPSLEFHYDSRDYWEEGSAFIKAGHFSILNYDQSVRGYAFPLVCCGLQYLGNLLSISPSAIVKLFSAFYISVLCCVLIPKFVERVFAVPCRWWQILLLSLLVFCFWRDYLAYPLTDFFALFLLLAAIAALLSSKPSRMLLAGFLTGLACNARPGYAIALGPTLLFLAVRGYRFSGSVFRSAILIGLYLLAIGVALLPQACINHRYFHTWSPGVVTSTEYQGGEFFQLVVLGLTIQKYETNIGENYPKPKAEFHDPIGEEMVAAAGGPSQIGYRYMARQLLHSPIQMAKLYWRHCFNGMDVKYATPYVTNIYDDFKWLAFLNYGLIYFALLLLVTRSVLPTQNIVRCYVFAVVALLCAVAVPTKIETRYFLPAYICLYAAIVFYPKYRLLYQGYTVEQRVKILCTGLIFVASCSLFSDDVFRQLK